MVKRRCNEKRIRCDKDDVEQISIVIMAQPENGQTQPVRHEKNQYGSGSDRGKYNKKNNLPKKKKRLRDIKSVEREVLQSIIGQDKQVRQIITAIYKAASFESIKSNILVIGNSGTGKTATIKQIAKKMRLPYTIEDATKYTKEGYYGADVNEMIYNLLDNANQDIERAQKGIIVIDEIDKKAGYNIRELDVGGVEVLKSLLKIIEESIIKIPDPEDPFGQGIDFDTKNLIIILLGAFSGLDKIRDNRLKKKRIGFSKNEPINELQQQNLKFTKQDLIAYGMPEEFVGRIDTIVEMNELNTESLALILKKSKLSIFRKYQKALREKGITLTYRGELFTKIADKSLSVDTGARELSNTVNYIFDNIMYEVLAAAPSKYKNCKLSLEIVEDNTKYELS